MGDEALRQHRVEALVEVVHAVLTGLASRSRSDDHAALDELLRDVVEGVEQKLGIALAGSGLAPAPDSPAARVEAADDADLDVFPTTSRTDSPAHDENPAVGNQTVNFFGHAPEAPAPRISPRQMPDPPLDPVAPKAAGDESEASELEALRRENRELRARLEATPASSASAATVDLVPAKRLLEIFDVRSDSKLSGEELVEAILRHLEAIMSYFAKTHGNLIHAYVDSLRVPLKLQPFSVIFGDSLGDTDAFRHHLDALRSCWKILTGATWNRLRNWCDKQSRALSPEEIEALSRQEGAKPWDTYRDTFNRLDLYNNLMKMVRTYMMAELRSTIPDCLEEDRS